MGRMGTSRIIHQLKAASSIDLSGEDITCNSITIDTGVINAQSTGQVSISGSLYACGGGTAAQNTGSTGTSNIVGVVKAADQAGFYTYQEEVSMVGPIVNTASGTVCELSKKLPANAKILSVGMTTTNRSDQANMAVLLAISATAGTAKGTAVASGTQILGQDVGSGKLEAGSGGTDGDSEAYGGTPLDVGSKRSIYLANADTGNTVSTASIGSILVTINYYGNGAPS